MSTFPSLPSPHVVASARGSVVEPHGRADEVYRFGEFRLETATRTLWRAQVALPISPKAFDLLLKLTRNQERYVPFEELRRHLWPRVMVGPNSLAQVVRELRRLLRDDARAPRWIRTVRGHGYQFLGGSLKALPTRDGAQELRISRCHSDGMRTTIDMAGRVVVPAPLREQLGFEAGSELEVTVEDASIKLRRSNAEAG